MDCRDFCDQHVAFVDDTLAGIELVRMQRHLAECEDCAKHDAKIRRALLLFRNLPSIEPSADFSRRLEARLKDCQSDHLLVATQRNLRRGAVAATLASAAMLGYIATTLYHHTDAPRDIVMAPVFATIPEPEIMPISTSTPAIVASVTAGLTIWPAALFAEQAPVRFAHSKLELTNYTR
ncbi:MAG TPA: zf-HC2 domain-containing protein [Gemmatimonadaceae bacterium]|jgi:anti-sigma factor RsiW|nr:zf-HC2 domain-containing protein [Gemmatimonadaceae bacterium]